jgi:hypothetical protein
LVLILSKQDFSKFEEFISDGKSYSFGAYQTYKSKNGLFSVRTGNVISVLNFGDTEKS